MGASNKFNLYQVNFTANIKQRVLGAKIEHQVSQIHLCKPGLSKKDEEQIPLLINQWDTLKIKAPFYKAFLLTMLRHYKTLPF
jgi:hypothetical protein